MDCKESEGLLTPYLLGALDASEMTRVDLHVDNCPNCMGKLRREGETVTEMAFTVPQVAAPARIKERLFARVNAEAVAERRAMTLAEWGSTLTSRGKRLVARSGLAVAAALIAVVALGGFWMSNRLSTIEDLKEALVTQIETAAEEEAEMQEIAQNHRTLTAMMARPPTLVKALSGTEEAERAQGFIIVESTGTEAILSAIGLPALPEGKAYRVWLVENGIPYDAGVFTVDTTGYGISIIELDAPLEELNAVMITIDDTGVSVLRGDL